MSCLLAQPQGTGPLSSEEAARLVSQGSVLLRSSYSSHSLAIIVLFFIMVVCWVKSFTKLRLRAADSERQLGHMRSVAYIDGLTRLRNRYAWAEWE